MAHATSKCRGHGEDQVYWDASRKRSIGRQTLASARVRNKSVWSTDDVCGGIRCSRKSGLYRPSSSPEHEADIVGGFWHETDLALQFEHVTAGQRGGLPSALAQQCGPVTGDPEHVDLRGLVPPPTADDHIAGQPAVPGEQHGVLPACVLEYPRKVLLQARGRALTDGRALPAFNEIHIVAEDAEPEGQVGIGDLIQRIRCGAPDGDDSTHVTGPPQALQRVVNPLLRTPCDIRGLSFWTFRRENCLVSVDAADSHCTCR